MEGNGKQHFNNFLPMLQATGSIERTAGIAVGCFMLRMLNFTLTMSPRVLWSYIVQMKLSIL